MTAPKSDGPTVTDTARGLVGEVTAIHRSDPVSLRQVREYVAATGGRPQDWGDSADPHAAVVVPPLFFHAVCRPVLAEAELLDDGQYPTLGVEGVHGRTMAGGHAYEMVAPVRIGDVLTGRETLLSLQEKSGRSGPLVITTTETEYTNQEDVVVARYRQTIIFR